MKNKTNAELANKNISLLGKAKSASFAALSGLFTVLNFVYGLDNVNENKQETTNALDDFDYDNPSNPYYYEFHDYWENTVDPFPDDTL